MCESNTLKVILLLIMSWKLHIFEMFQQKDLGSVYTIWKVPLLNCKWFSLESNHLITI